MATNKKTLKVYLDREVDEDLEILYKIWEIRSRKRGITPSKNKFIESIIGDYVKVAKAAFIAEAKEKYAKKEG
jgi:hypothetical protein